MSLTFQYITSGVTSSLQGSKATCVAGEYPVCTSIQVTNANGFTQTFDVCDGDIFKLDGPFDAATTFFFGASQDDCYIHTSCSVPIVDQDQVGPFKILAGNDCNSVPTNSTPIEPLENTDTVEDVCIICAEDSSMPKPTSLTVVYNSDGKTSEYMGNKASCKAGTYPIDGTVTFTNLNGETQIFNATNGNVMVLQGPFDDQLEFFFSDGSSCTMDLSCSSMVVAGDTVGPFLLVEGNDCVYETQEPSQAPTEFPSQSPTLFPTDMPSPQPSVSPAPTITPYPTVSPSSAPTASPTNQPSSAPSTGFPSVSPTGAPSTSQAPTQAPCIEVARTEFQYGEAIAISFNAVYYPESPFNDGWICMYPCAVTDYFLDSAWSCNEMPGNCYPANDSGEVLFQTVPSSTSQWPIAPYIQADGSTNNCYKAVAIQRDGNGSGSAGGIGVSAVPQCETPEITVSVDSCPERS
jgi:hypothetical protein